MKRIILFPFGGNARESILPILAVNAFKKTWDIVGFMDDDPLLAGKVCCGVKVKGGRELLKKFPKALVLALPGRDANYLGRKKIIESLRIDRKRFATIIHPDVSIAEDAKIGCNVMIMPNVVISCGVKIGDHCVILPNTVISHDSQVGNYTLIGSNVSISGGVVIEDSCYIGSGSRIIQEVRIGKGALVGLGSVVISPVPKETAVAGCPAKNIKSVKLSKQILIKG